MTAAHAAILGIAALTIAGVIVRPWRLPEATWAVLGAAALILFSLISPSDALLAVRKGTDVYFFLIGMMLLAEFARHEGSSIGWRPMRCAVQAGSPSGCSRWSMAWVRS
jgi:arsenical pump membrane protein